MHKQEMLELRQQLKTTSMSNKGGEKESDRLKKELDKARSGLCSELAANTVSRVKLVSPASIIRCFDSLL